MLEINQFYSFSILVFIVAATTNLAIIVFYIKDFRGASGSYIQLAINQYKNGGIKGKLFAFSLVVIISCFGFWVALALIK